MSQRSRGKMASGAISTDFKKISELRVVDLKSELKLRNLDTTGVKSILLARLKQAIQDEDGDPEKIQIQLSTDSASRKSGKFKGKKTDSDVDTTAEEDNYVKENEECESEKDVTDTDDGTRENSKPPPCGENLAYSEAETEAVVPEDDSEPEPEADVEPGDEDAEAETEVPELDAEAMSPSKDAEDDHLFVSMQNEDAITLDVDGDDLLDTGKHVKLPDPEAEKSVDEPEGSADTDPDDDMKDKEVEGPKDGKNDDESGDETTKKDNRDALKKAETGDKDKDSGNKGPSTTGASGQEKSSSRDRDGKSAKDEKVGSNSSSSQNLWVSGLSSNTKAADLKNLFGKYGKVLSAKVVTNARSPGSKCYGLVTMSSSTEVARCITHLDCTELHGQEIYVERAKNDPFKKGPSKNEEEDKASSSKLNEKRISTGTKMTNKAQTSNKKVEKKPEKSFDKDKDLLKKQEARSGRSELVSSNSDQDSLKKDDKHGRSMSPGKVMIVDHNKGDPNFRPRPFRRGRYFDQPFPNPYFQRQPRWLIPPEELEMIRQKRRQFSNKDEDGEILPFEKIKELREQRMRERMERVRRAVDLRRRREIAEQERRERERVRLLRESEEHENLLRERQRLEMERQQLERERLERERLERERIRIEQERRKEAERIAREREDLRRQQEQLRFEQEKRNNFKRGREAEHGRREGPFWNGNKKIQMESEVRSNQGSNFNRPQNRFSSFNPRERGRFPEAGAQQPNTFDRRNRFDGEPEMKKSRPAPLREGTAIDRYPKNFDTVRRPVPPTRGDVRDIDRRDRDDRRPAPMHDRPVGPRATLPTMSQTRTARVGGHGVWKNEGLTPKGDIRAPIRVHSERAGPSVNRGRSSFNDRDEGRPVTINNQTFGSGRQVVVERHSRDQGLRKDWHNSPSSQGAGFTDNRRIADSRGSVMTSGHSSGIGRIVQITNNSNPSGGAVGGFKPFKGVPRPF